MNTMPYSHKSVLIDLLDAKVKEFDKTGDLGLQSYIEGLKQAQTFRLPHFESLPSIGDYKSFYEFMKSPYHSYLIEMPLDDGGWLMLNIIDYTDIKKTTDEINELKKDLNKRKWWQFKKKEFEKDSYEFSGLTCAVFSQKDKFGEWGAFGHFRIDMNEDRYKITENNVEEFNGTIIDELALAIFRFMVAVNTPNIDQLEIKAPKLINAKREKKGKPLLEGYKYLDLVPRDQLSHDATGTGTTKRMHWRRGHIRRLADRTTWVRPALIGKHGFVDKTYRLNP